jgi:prophage tail gpP-like protein
MSKPIPGVPYVVKPGDTLSQIAYAAYGRAYKWKDIWQANKSTLISGDPHRIYPLETLVIPIDLELLDQKVALRDLGIPVLSGKAKNDFTLVIDGEEMTVTAGRAVRTMDTCADMWTATIQWDPSDKKIRDTTAPFGYQSAQCYLGEPLLVDGYLTTVEPVMTPTGITKNLEGYSKTIDLVDSTVPKPYEQKLVTLDARAKTLVSAFGINVVSKLTDAGALEPFKKVTAKPSDTIFSHLSELAAQRGILISSSILGELEFLRTITEIDPLARTVGTLEEGIPPLSNMTIRYDARKRFNAYTAIGHSPKKKIFTATANDDVVPKTRMMSFDVHDCTKGNIQQSADWKRSKQIIEALKFSIPVDGWYAPDGALWRENTLVTVVSPSMHLEEGFDFLIRAVEYSYEAGGTSAVLSLVPPQAYTGAEIEEPWLKGGLLGL